MVEKQFSLYINSTTLCIGHRYNGYILKNDLKMVNHQNKALNICVILIFSLALTLVLKELYYFFAPQIWQMNIIYKQEDLTPWIWGWNTQRDGVEIYALYMLSIFSLAGSFALYWVDLMNKKIKFIAMALLAYFSIALITGSELPRPYENELVEAVPAITISILLALLPAIYIFGCSIRGGKYSQSLLYIFTALSCFTLSSQIAITNYAYILAPAIKILNGVNLSEIYFQYDLIPSILSALWIASGIKYQYIYILAQASLFLLFVLIYQLSKKLFDNKNLAIILLFTLIQIKIMSAPWDPVYVMQTTPIRLELWIIPLFIIYKYGIDSPLNPIALCLLLIFHRNFGIIYAISYIEIIFTIGIFGYLRNKKFGFSNIKLFIILVTLTISALISSKYFEQNISITSLYQKIGIGFLKIDKKSSFWVILTMFPIFIFYLYKISNIANKRYLNVGISILFFAIGNCIYFFGRSHELNLFSICVPLIFSAFYLYDVICRVYKFSDPYKTLIIPLVFLMVLAISFKSAIYSNLTKKIENVGMLLQNPFLEEEENADAIFKYTNSQFPNRNVILLTQNEGLEFTYYQRIQKNTIFFDPFNSWVFRKSLMNYVENEIRNNSVILIDKIWIDMYKNSIGIDFKSQKVPNMDLIAVFK